MDSRERPGLEEERGEQKWEWEWEEKREESGSRSGSVSRNKSGSGSGSGREGEKEREGRTAVQHVCFDVAARHGWYSVVWPQNGCIPCNWLGVQERRARVCGKTQSTRSTPLCWAKGLNIHFSLYHKTKSGAHISLIWGSHSVTLTNLQTKSNHKEKIRCRLPSLPPLSTANTPPHAARKNDFLLFVLAAFVT